MKNCPCAFKQQMLTEMLKLPVKHPNGQYNWVKLFGDSTDDSFCCLLTFLFYYAYCQECSGPLSEKARAVLKPLMDPAE